MALPVKLQANEELVAVRRRHPAYAIIKAIVAAIVGALVIWLLAWIFGRFSGASPARFWLYGAAVVVALGYVGLVYYRWQNDIWVITNQRLVDSVRKTPFNQSTSSTDLLNVQDINVRKRGIMASIFNFGDVLCQTASTRGQFSFRGVADPNDLLEELDRLRDEARKSNVQFIGQAIGQSGQ
jgi:uncharacterized membrane protein YdbT with pleckstrin-like domain